jgi:hypothetical protein
MFPACAVRRHAGIADTLVRTPLGVCQYYTSYNSYSGRIELKMCFCIKDENLGLVSVSRLKAPRLSVSSRSRSSFEYPKVSVSDS